MGPFNLGSHAFQFYGTMLYSSHDNSILSSIAFQKFYYLGSKLIKLTLFSDIVLLFSVIIFSYFFEPQRFYDPFPSYSDLL